MRGRPQNLGQATADRLDSPRRWGGGAQEQVHWEHLLQALNVVCALHRQQFGKSVEQAGWPEVHPASTQNLLHTCSCCEPPGSSIWEELGMTSELALQSQAW